MFNDLSGEAVVFIVDDDRAVQDSLSIAFELFDVPTRVYSSAQEFLDDFAPVANGCLIADMRLPGMCGLEMIEELRKRGATLPAILITGHGDEELQQQAKKASVWAVFQKPFRFEELAASVDEALRHHDSGASS